MTSSRRIDVLVVGGANFDYEIRAPALPRPGETVVGEVLLEAPAGKGANQAVAAARLGAAAAFVGRVGNASAAGASSPSSGRSGSIPAV